MRGDALPRLALPEWLHDWALRAPPPAPNASVRVLVVAFGLVRSLPMLETTLASLVRFAPADTTLVVRADVPERLFGEALVRRLQDLDLRTVNVTLFSARVPNGTLACNGSTQRAAEHSNELRAARLLKSVDDDDAWDEAHVVVLWRLDTELVSPIEAPALPPDRVLLPYLQSGGQLNDRYLVGHVEVVRKLVERRASLLEAECVYGEPALVRLLRELRLRVGFTRTRIVRRRADLWIPDVDRAASLGSIPARSWMQKINTLSPELLCDNRTALCTMQQVRVLGVHGRSHACPFFRPWESRCEWSEPPQTDLPPLPHPRNAPRGRLLVMGDSMDAQLFAATACHLWEHQRNGAKLNLRFEAGWANSVAALRKRCGAETTKCHYERASLCVDGEDAWRVPFRSMHLCQGDRPTCLDDLGYNESDWVVTGADALHGVAHGVPGAMGRNGVPNRTIVAEAARRDANSVLDLVPASALVWREATAQHFHAPGGHWTHGFMLRSNVEKLEKRCANINYAELKRHAHWNPVSTPLMTIQGVKVLRAWDESARAWYAHVDHGDCTHFCQPSPLLNGWATRLLRLVSPSR
jgi:hypothetical protein